MIDYHVEVWPANPLTTRSIWKYPSLALHMPVLMVAIGNSFWIFAIFGKVFDVLKTRKLFLSQEFYYLHVLQSSIYIEQL